MIRLVSTATSTLVLALAIGAGPTPARAQTPQWGNGFGFQWQIGGKTVGGGYAELLTGGVDADINIFYDYNKLRIGGGGNFISFNVVEPFEDESISSVELHAFVGYHFLRGPFQPYVQGRFTFVRLRPEGHDFAIEDPDAPEDPEEGENVSDRRSGFGGGLVGGFEYRVSRRVGLEANASIDRWSTDEVDLTEEGIEGVFTSGTKWGFRVGINWYP